MPELPEVEASRQFVLKHCLGCTVSSCVTSEQGGGPRDGLYDDIIIAERTTPEQLKGAMEGKTLVDVGRRGKQLWFTFAGRGTAKDGPSVLFHFGMTGAFVVKGHGAMKYKAFKVDVANWPPRFCKLEMTFKRVKRTETETEPGQRTGRKRRGAETVCQAKDANAERNGSDDDDDDEKVVPAFTDPRRLGRVRLRDGNPLSSPPLSLLAPDPMEESGLGRTAEQAISILGATVAPIKSVLLDQSRLVCGVGNWVADDVLYEANIHPATKSRDLSNDQVLALLAAIKSICEQACAVGADASKFPPHWLFHYRWKMRPKTSQTVADGRYLACETMSGRTTVFVPKVQKKGNGGGGGRSSSSSSSKTAVVGAAAAKPKGNAKGKGKGGATPTAKGNAKAHARGKAKGGLPVEKKPNQEPSTSPPERKRKQQQQQPTKTVSLTAPTAAAGRRASQRRRF